MRNETLAAALMPVLMTLLASCDFGHQEPEGTATTKEAWDVANRPSLVGVRAMRYEELAQPKALRGAVPSKPWKDSYWPYHRKNIAYRYASGADFAAFADQTASAASNPGDPMLSPSEKYDVLLNDNAFSLTHESWVLHDYYKQKYGADLGKWSWMGICAGWAPASIAETAPEHHVLAVGPSGREVLFFAGDIRALLSKAYDINTTTGGYRMVGSRCNEPEYAVPRDRLGRALDGRINSTFESFVILSDFGRTTGALEVTRDPLDPNPFWLLAAEPLAKMSGLARFWIYDSRENLVADLEADTRGAHASRPDQVDVQLYKSCRDVNPASLHFAMVQNISDAAATKSSFVVELSRDLEVWNHPVWGFTAKVGQPRPLSSEPPARRVFRAPGTSYVMDVDATLIYVTGAAPQASYQGDDGTALNWREFDQRPWSFPTLELGYTLELDASGLVIGGEWNESTDTRLALPDFFWKTFGTVTDDLKDGGSSPLKYSIVKQIAACSQQAPNVSVPASVNGSSTVEAVRCPVAL